jgi:hypothetical protein
MVVFVESRDFLVGSMTRQSEGKVGVFWDVFDEAPKLISFNESFNQ